MNILILSAGTRNKIVQYFRRELTDSDGKRTGYVIAADMTKMAPALYEADRFYQVPRITEDGYLSTVFEICHTEHVGIVLSLIDPELSLLAANSEEFAKIGVLIVGSNENLCNLCLDKLEMYAWLVGHGYQTPLTYIDQDSLLEDIHSENMRYPVFAKPRKGSASLNISRAYNKRDIEYLLSVDNELIFQEYMLGEEIGADVYIDLVSGEVVSIFTKKKLVMRAGETDKAVSFKDDKLFALIERFVLEAGFRGQVDIDLFKREGQYYISEVNPRFGGGYPHAYECGCNHINLILNNAKGIANAKQIGNYKEGIYMMKYSEIMTRKIT